MEYKTFKLSNGIRLIHQHNNSELAHFGIIINTGSRDEDEDQQGLAHFVEHVIFKGTARRNAYRIISRIDDVGGEINAYTSKEETVVYSTFLKNYYQRTIDLISDITFNSVFPEKELLKEKEVILDEINSYLDNPSEQIFDDFEEQIFCNSMLGRNILGTPESVQTFSSQHIKQFINCKYHTDQIILSSYGNIKFDKLVLLIEKYFGHIHANHRNFERTLFQTYSPLRKETDKGTFQAHCVIGNIAYNVFDKRRPALCLLNNLLGGQALNSRLNMALREKHGYSYNVESNYSAYTDTGLLTFYFSSDKKNLDKSIKLVHNELRKLQTQELGKVQLAKAKRQIIGHLAISAENKESYMLSMGKSYLLFNKVDTTEEVFRKIEEITAKQIIEIANDVFALDKLSTLIYV